MQSATKLPKTTIIPEAPSLCFRPMGRSEVVPVLQRYGVDSPYILYVGSGETRKNLVRLLDAFARLPQANHGWKLVIVGACDSQGGPIAKAVTRLGLRDAVHFTGPAREDDLPALYAGAALFVFPSLIEGFGLPVIEAMACGTPVITSMTSSLPEVAGDAAILVDPYDPTAIEDAMRRVLEDRVLANELRARGLVRARQLTWEQIARRTALLYEEVLAPRSEP